MGSRDKENLCTSAQSRSCTRDFQSVPVGVLLLKRVCLSFFLCRVKAAQSELGTQILADFDEAFPAQGSKVLHCNQGKKQLILHLLYITLICNLLHFENVWLHI